MARDRRFDSYQYRNSNLKFIMFDNTLSNKNHDNINTTNENKASEFR